MKHSTEHISLETMPDYIEVWMIGCRLYFSVFIICQIHNYAISPGVGGVREYVRRAAEAF